jgi:hypothetical protein
MALTQKEKKDLKALGIDERLYNDFVLILKAIYKNAKSLYPTTTRQLPNDYAIELAHYPEFVWQVDARFVNNKYIEVQCKHAKTDQAYLTIVYAGNLKALLNSVFSIVLQPLKPMQ